MNECPICRKKNAQIVYDNLKDKLFYSKLSISLVCCKNRHCGHISSLTRFSESEISEMYSHYYTHENVNPKNPLFKKNIFEILMNLFLNSRSIGQISTFKYFISAFLIFFVCVFFPWLKSYLLSNSFFLKNISSKSVLEIGCGDGKNLFRFKDRGIQAYALDFDVAAVEAAKSNGIDAKVGGVGSVGDFNRRFDIIVLRHVIEHLPDPVDALKILSKFLQKNGSLVLITPNGTSFGHSYFGAHWRGLEPPRHLNIFTENSIKNSLERSNFKNPCVFTYPSLGPSIYHQSLMIKNSNRNRLMAAINAIFLAYIGWVLYLFDKSSGEEIVAFAERK